MPRNMDAALATALTGKVLCPILLVDLAINGQTLYIWSGRGTYPWNANNYVGIGDLGQFVPAQESTDIQANGAQLSVSGVDPTMVNAALEEIQLGAPSTVRLGVVDQNTLQLIGAPVVIFSGLVDVPTDSLGAANQNGEPAKATITIPLESRLALLGSGQQRRLSLADQNLTYPNDIGLAWVSILNMLALDWNP